MKPQLYQASFILLLIGCNLNHSSAQKSYSCEDLGDIVVANFTFNVIPWLDDFNIA